MKLQIDLDKLAANPTAAMRRVTQLFQRAGLPVIDVASDGKVRRIADVSFREVELSFADSQRLALRVKATGDIYEVRVNGRIQPMREQSDPAKAVGELVALLDAGRARFQKRLAALAMKPPPGIKTAVPKLRDQLAQQVTEVEAAVEAARQELAELEAA